MSKLDVTERLAFLAKKFDVFETDSDGNANDKRNSLHDEGWEEITIYGGRDNHLVMAVVSTKPNKRGFPIIKVSVAYTVFTAMVGADPTANKISLQWMLNTFCRDLKEGYDDEARRFVEEDLPQANEYLTLFEGNKRKKKFREMAEYSLKGFKDITNINEYRSLSQLFDAVDPFIIRDPSEIESIMNRYVNMGQATIPFKDRRYTVFVPKTLDANVVFDKFASWCTAKVGNGMFKTYTKNHSKPNGKDADIYIVIDNGFFEGKNENIYQLHFETRQIKDRSNSMHKNVDLYDEVLSRSIGLTNYLGSELMGMAKDFKGGVDSNHYVDTLIEFGFTETLFEFFDVETPIIKIDSETSKKKRKVPKLPDMSRFKALEMMVIMDSSLSELHPSIGSLKNLMLLSLYGNKIKELPSEIGELKNLYFMNLVGNPITVIPDSIKNLDKSRGGNLHRLAINKKDISENNYQKLVELLPSVKFN
jgi:hypothetical protein